MAAIKVRVLHLRPTLLRPHAYPLHHFSSSSDIPPPQPPPPPPSQPSFSSHFNDVKATLRREPNRPQSFRKPSSFPNSNPNQSPPPPGIEPLEEIRRNLSAFRSRAPQPPPTSGPYVSFQELYKRNVISNSDDNNPNSTTATPTNTVQSFDAIRESLRNLRANSPKNQNYSPEKSFDPTSLARIRDTLNLKPDRNADQNPITGGTDSLPSSIFGKEKISEADDVHMRTSFVKMYDVDELGTKLKMLRPEKKKGKWFSLHELNERLAKLREIEEKEYKGRVGGASFKDLRDTLLQLKKSDDHKLKNRTAQRLGVLSQLGVTPSYMLSPPNDNLVEKYFHPDNMSSAEKLKLELKKVRDEFKMSESDCGSARVQVAQLTTKIKHLSTVLQKKDKHSRRGLQAMVQRRKKLLKYLRRTDWDSYSLVLSKLGLRDNPDIKA